MNVEQIILYRTIIFIHKMVNGQVPNYLSNRIKYRNANQIDTIDVIKMCSQNSLFFKGIKQFNELSREIREEDNLFRSALLYQPHFVTTNRH